MKKFYAFLFFLVGSCFSISIAQTTYVWDNFAGSTDWFDDSNWLDSSSPGSTIASGDSVVIQGSTASPVLNETPITNNGALYIDGVNSEGSALLYITNGANITNNGDITIASGGRFYIRNSNTQVINNGSIYNAGDMRFIQDGSLTIEPSGVFNSEAGNIEGAISTTITINSNSSGTGSIIYNSSLAGTFNQYIEDDKWHFVTVPFSGLTTASYFDGSSGTAWMRPYDVASQAWDDYFTEGTESLTVGEGYQIWQLNDFTFSETGTFITGSQSLPIVSVAGEENPSWNLLGNPYPCALDWSEVEDRTNAFGSAFYIYNGSAYVSHNGTSGTATSEMIPPFQGFFVDGESGTSISIDDNDKAHAGIPLYKSSKEVEYFNHFKVRATGAEQESVCVIYQQEGATNGVDAIYDAPIMFNNDTTFMEVYSLAGDKQSCINIFGDYPYTVPVGLRVPYGANEFTLEPFDFRNIDETFTIFIEDLETGDYLPFGEGSSYTFNISESGMIEDRFLLHLNSTVGIEDEELVNMNIYAHLNKIYINDLDLNKYSVFIYSMTGQLIHEAHNLSGNEVISIDQPTGNYLVKAFNEQGSTIKKVNVINP